MTDSNESGAPHDGGRIDISSILEQAYAQGSARPQRHRAPGPGSDCLTIADIERVSEEGFAGGALEHFLTCRDCGRTVLNHLASMRKERSEIVHRREQSAAARVGVWDRIHSLLPWNETPVFQPAVLGFSSSVFEVEGSGGTRNVRVRILPFAAEHVDPLDLTKLRLQGCLRASETSKVEVVDVDEDGTPDLWDVTFLNVELAPKVKAGIDNHQNVIDWASVSGLYGDGSCKVFGEARLEFQPTPATSGQEGGMKLKAVDPKPGVIAEDAPLSPRLRG